MKNTMIALLLATCLAVPSLSAQVKAYNNGTTEFVPPGTTFELTANDQLIGVAKTQYTINGGEALEYS